VSLEYNSAAGPGIAGVGWDLSSSWPSLIARDTRFGTPTWDLDGPWLWGGAPLVLSTVPGACAAQPGPCYRTAPDSLAMVVIDARVVDASGASVVPFATVTMPTGVVLHYEALRYDGAAYPAAPPGSQTDVFAFVLSSAVDPNGYRTCYLNQRWPNANQPGHTNYGRVAVLKEIVYGREISDCAQLPPIQRIHHLVFEYDDPLASGYFSLLSYRFGAAVSFNNLLRSIEVLAADSGASAPALQARYNLVYEPASATETRLARLEKVIQESAGQTRTLRRFAYGSRNIQFDAVPLLADIGPDARDFPESLSGTETRPMRMVNLFSNLLKPGLDQPDVAAPASHAVTRQWGLLDLNGDALLDTVVADERGAEPAQPWATFEGTIPPGAKPPQQWVYLNEGITNGTPNGAVALTGLGG
jgi:hypothetical protein